jgi:IS5 family transposase
LDVQLDSTSVKASSCWPTDASVIFKLISRVYVRGGKLDRLGLEPFKDFYMVIWLKELKKLLFEINNTRSKNEKKLKSLYGRHLRTAHKALGYLSRTLDKRLPEAEKTDRLPSVRLALGEILGAMEDDLLTLSAVLYYSEERIFNGIVLPSTEKILSISDSSAAFIKKGQRESVIGYKPQLCRSAKGFVTAMILEKGNPFDSEKLFPLVERHIVNTGVKPKLVSTDSGYASGKGYSDCIGLGVEDVCIGGSKGKALLPEELWLSEKYVSGRRMRSAVESLMFTLKYVFEFGLPRRRGLENVRDEMTEKITAYNFVKMLRMKEERRMDKENPLKKTA